MLSTGFPVGKESTCNAGYSSSVPGLGIANNRRERLTTSVFLGFPCGSAGKESTRNAGDLSLIPGLGGSPGEGKGYPLQYSGLENYMDGIVHGLVKRWTLLSNFHSFIPSSWNSLLLGILFFKKASCLLTDSVPPESTNLYDSNDYLDITKNGPLEP